MYLKSLSIILFLSSNYIYAQHRDSLKSSSIEEVVMKTEANRKYKIDETSSSLRISSKIIDIPQNIQVIDASVLKDQLILNVNEGVVRNVSGTFREELHNGISADIYSRGGYINPQRNGVDLRPLLKGPLGDDISVIDDIEFVKGPSTFMNSLGDPAGSYNIVTKKPDGMLRNTVSLSQGSFGLIRSEADISRDLNNEGKLFYRINLMGMYKNGFMKFDKNNRFIIAPSVQYNFENGSYISVEYIYQHLNYMMLSEAQISPYGFGSLPIDFTLTDPSNKPYNANEHNVFVKYHRKLGKKWTFDTQVSNINNQSVGNIYWAYDKNYDNPDILNRYYVYDGSKYNTFSAQAFVKGDVQTGKLHHYFLGGVDYNYKTNKTQDTWNTAQTIYPLSISNPVYSNVINNSGYGGDFNSENKIDGIDNISVGRLYYISPYISDEIRLLNDKLFINPGLRLTYANSRFNSYGTLTNSEDWNLSPRVGITYKIINSLAVYGLYDNSFIPIAGKSYDEKPLKPIKGRSFELGIKKDWLDSFSTSLSAYAIRRSNTTINDPITNDLYQTGENESNGIEFDAKGKLFKDLHFNINYAYTDSKITKDDKNPILIGKPTPNRIRHIQNTWLNYSISKGKLSGLGFLLGYQLLIGRSERFTSSSPEKMNDIFRMDGGVSYQKGKINISFAVNNILNSHQYSTAWKQNDMYYWVQLAPINYRCSVSIKF